MTNAVPTDLTKVALRLTKRMLADATPQIRIDARRALAELEADEYEQGNFTIVILKDKKTGILQAVGASKRMATDPEDNVIGYNLALIRAVESFIDKNY